MFQLTSEPIDVAALRINSLDSAAGAYATFEGWVRNRNEGRDVLMLEYEAYPVMSHQQGSQILADANDRFDIISCVCVHRLGLLEIGNIAVWIGVCAVHRGPAFDACRFIIDQVKQRVPIWKKEHFNDGDSCWVGLNSNSTGDGGPEAC